MLAGCYCINDLMQVLVGLHEGKALVQLNRKIYLLEAAKKEICRKVSRVKCNS